MVTIVKIDMFCGMRLQKKNHPYKEESWFLTMSPIKKGSKMFLPPKKTKKQKQIYLLKKKRLTTIETKFTTTLFFAGTYDNDAHDNDSHDIFTDRDIFSRHSPSNE
jgi:hypothetical protein